MDRRKASEHFAEANGDPNKDQRKIDSSFKRACCTILELSWSFTCKIKLFPEICAKPEIQIYGDFWMLGIIVA